MTSVLVVMQDLRREAGLRLVGRLHDVSPGPVNHHVAFPPASSLLFYVNSASHVNQDAQ